MRSTIKLKAFILAGSIIATSMNPFSTIVIADSLSGNEMGVVEETLSENTASDNDAETSSTPMLRSLGSKGTAMLGVSSTQYQTRIHFMLQKNTATSETIGEDNYSRYGSTLTLTTNNGQQTSKTGDEIFSTINQAATGYAPLDDNIYEYKSGQYMVVSTRSDTLYSNANQNVDYFIFYVNTCIWDKTNHRPVSNKLTVKTDLGDISGFRFETLKIYVNGVETSNNSNIPCGSSVSITMQPQDQYILSWMAQEQTVGTSGNHRAVNPTYASGRTYDFTMGSKPLIVIPTAIKKTLYTVTYAGISGATFEGDQINPNPTTVYNGEQYVLKRPSIACKRFVGWQLNDAQQTLITDDKLDNITQNIVATAKWVDAKYQLSINYIYKDDLRSNLPINEDLVTVKLIRDNNKDDLVLTSKQYSFDKPYVEYGQNDYEASVQKDIIMQIENKENGLTSAYVQPDSTPIGTGKVSINSVIKTIINKEKFEYEPLAKKPGEKKVKIMASNKKAAKASNKGVIVGKKTPGICKLYKTVNKSTVSGSEIIVYNEVPKYTKSIKLAYAGNRKNIGLTGITGKVEYESEDPMVAYVDQLGNVTAMTSYGSTKIHIKIHDKDFKVKVKVGKKVETIDGNF